MANTTKALRIVIPGGTGPEAARDLVRRVREESVEAKSRKWTETTLEEARERTT